MHMILKKASEREIERLKQTAINDWTTMMNSAREEGIKEGIKQSRLEVAQKLKKDGFEPEFIAKYTGLTLSEIAQL